MIGSCRVGKTCIALLCPETCKETGVSYVVISKSILECDSKDLLRLFTQS